MLIKNSLLILAALIAPLAIGQQPSPQPTQAQGQPVPCVTTPTNPNPSGYNPAVKVPSKWQQVLDKQRQQLAAKTGIAIPDPSTAIAQPATPKSNSCPPQAASPKPPPPTQAPILRLPPDTTLTLRCNPLTPSPKDGSAHPTTLTLPDPHDFAVPKANDTEFDAVVPDLSAKTQCYRIKIDPATGKSFIAE